ncbi:MAG: flagellar protein FlgN [Phycisphaeraceae bacterium]
MDEMHTFQTQPLEETLKRMTAQHEQLLSLLERKRAAVREGDEQQVAALCRLENEALRTISELETTRAQQVGELTLQVEPNANAPLRLAVLAERLPEPARGRLLVLRSQLRQRMEQVREQTSIARRATESLARHMQGLVQTIGVLATGVSTYDDSGAVPRQATAMSTINVTA